MKAHVQILDGFEDARFGRERWNALVRRSETCVVFLTWEWQRAWWEVFGRGRLLLLLAQGEGAEAVLAPLFVDGGMAFLVGSGGSDYLDLIGGTEDAALLMALLRAALRAEPELLGFRFYHVPKTSRTGMQLRAVADELELTCVDEGELVAPALMSSASSEIRRAADRRSLLRHERFFQRDGALTIEHLQQADAILPQLPSFFAQHIRRWEATTHPSLFLDAAQKSFCRLLTERAGPAGWLRFTRIDYNGDPIAFHFGFSYADRFLWYKPSFAIEWAKRSPGEVLLRQLFLAAEAEGSRIFDFGLGDEAFKHRFANHIQRVQTWGLYPKPERQTS